MNETEIDEVDLLLLDLCELLIGHRLSAVQAVEITSQRIAELYGEMQREATHDAPSMIQ